MEGSVHQKLLRKFHQGLKSGTMSRVSLFMESRRTWTFLKDHEMVSDGRELK